MSQNGVRSTPLSLVRPVITQSPPTPPILADRTPPPPGVLAALTLVSLPKTPFGGGGGPCGDSSQPPHPSFYLLGEERRAHRTPHPRATQRSPRRRPETAHRIISARVTQARRGGPAVHCRSLPQTPHDHWSQRPCQHNVDTHHSRRHCQRRRCPSELREGLNPRNWLCRPLTPGRTPCRTTMVRPGLPPPP